MIEQHLPVLQVVIPLIAAPICIILRRRELVLPFTILVGWITFAASVAQERDRLDPTRIDIAT